MFFKLNIVSHEYYKENTVFQNKSKVSTVEFYGNTLKITTQVTIMNIKRAFKLSLFQ